MSVAWRSMLGVLTILILSPTIRADDPPAPKADEPAAKPSGNAYREDVPTEFEPLRPRTAADRNRVEALRDYAVARALEDRRQWNAAIRTLEQALEKAPDSVAILRRLARLHMARGQAEKAVEVSRKVLAAEPGDTEALHFLVRYLVEIKKDPAATEALLKSVLDNPRLEPSSPARLLAGRQLGELYLGTDRAEQAADALAGVVKALDEKAANALSPAQQQLILGVEPARAYLAFGDIFLKVGRYDLAVLAFQRGLAYDPEHAELPRTLAQALLKAGQPAEALASVETAIRRKPRDHEPYELLAEILTALDRQAEVVPRLEAATKADASNLALQAVLADQYRAAGQDDKAEALYKTLLARNADPRVIGALATALLKSKKTEDLIRVLGDGFARPETLNAVHGTLESIVKDSAYADELLEVGIKLQEADPPKLDKNARLILTYIATNASKFDRLIELQRTLLDQNPDDLSAHAELAEALRLGGKYPEAAEALTKLLEKFPDQKNARLLISLGRLRLMTGDNEAALKAARESLDLAADDPDALLLVGYLLGQLGKHDEALAHYRDIIARFPNNGELVKRAHSGISNTHVNLDQLDEAEEALETVLKTDPDDPGINNDLGYLYADRGKHLERAETMIRKAVEADPENGSYLDSLGWVLYKLGRVADALDPLEKAAKAPEADATILDHLGDVYYRLKRPADAKSAWKRAEDSAAKANPPDKRLAEIRKKLDALGKLGAADDDSPGEKP